MAFEKLEALVKEDIRARKETLNEYLEQEREVNELIKEGTAKNLSAQENSEFQLPLIGESIALLNEEIEYRKNMLKRIADERNKQAEAKRNKKNLNV